MGKAVNALISVKSNKDRRAELEKEYLRPKNCNVKVLWLNKEIGMLTGEMPNATDLNLQIIQRYLATGWIPLVQIA